MKNLTEIINEASINAKKRNVKFIKNLLLNNKNVGKIGSFVIFTAENPSSQKLDKKMNKKLMKNLSNDLKRCHYVHVPIDGFFSKNKEHSRIVFNMDLETAKEWNKEYDQTSFFYVYPTNDGFMAEYWEKTNIDKPADNLLNPYIQKGKTNMQHEGENEYGDYSIISNNYKFYFDSSLFEAISNDISNRLKVYCESHSDIDEDKLLNYITNCIGQKVSYIRSKIFY